MSELRWQCRRGMQELDVLLTRYLDGRYATASDEEKQAFRRLLKLPDPQLVEYLLRGETSGEPTLDKVLVELRG